MYKAGIDNIDFYIPKYYLDLKTLARKRDVDVNKFHVGLGQYKMSYAAPCEDIVTMGANVASRILEKVDPNEIDTILFATESGFDQAKSAATYIHRLLGLPKRCRIVELKQACYGTTAALQLGISLVLRNPNKKVLIISSDIAKYSMYSAAESSQGAGAVAMLLSSDPKLLVLEPGSGLYTEEVMDFWRPNYKKAAIVEGKYSSMVYLRALESVWNHFKQETGRKFSEIDLHCYHSALPRLVEKAHRLFSKINEANISDAEAKAIVADTLKYSREIGNSYTAALYISLISLLENKKEDLSKKRIGFYSYGSGCVAEYFSGIIQKTYQSTLDVDKHQQMLADRQELSYADYERFYHFSLPIDGSKLLTENYDTGKFRLAGIDKHKRIYEKV